MPLTLHDAVAQLTLALVDAPDSDLETPWAWGAHPEDLRFAFLGTYQELEALTVQTEQLRAESGNPETSAQRILSRYIEGFRTFEAIVQGAQSTLDERPGEDAWPLRTVFAHLMQTQRAFRALTEYAVERHRGSVTGPAAIEEAEFLRRSGPWESFDEMIEASSLLELMDEYERINALTIETLQSITEDELDAPSVWWEGHPYTARHRLHRMDAHLRQHSLQADRIVTFAWGPVSEARQLARLVWSACGAAEGAAIGAGAQLLPLHRSVAQELADRVADVAQIWPPPQA